MISAPSHQPRSNGNDLLVLFVLALLLSSCTLFRPAGAGEQKPRSRKDDKKTEKVTRKEEEEPLLDPVPGKKVYDPETGTLVVVDQTPVETMDTIRWKEVPYDSIPPIRSQVLAGEEDKSDAPERTGRGEYGTEFYSFYKIALILPFLTDDYNSSNSEINERSNWALQFYGGAQMAFEKLEDEGARLNIAVMDSKADTRRMDTLLTSRSELLDAHLIIGPYRKENVEKVASFAQRTGKAYVSPHSASSGIATGNPDYIQVSPTLESHCKAITRHVRQHFRPGQVVLVARDKDAETARFPYFQNENYLIEGVRHDSVKFKEYVVEERSASFQNINLAPFLTAMDTVAFVLPSWSNETFILSFLSRLKLARQPYNYVEVYGMPQWMSYERMDYDLYEGLNVHVSSDTYIDPYDQEVQLFRRRFFDRYGIPPRDEAFLGYDVMLYFGRMIKKYGTKFQYSLEKEPQQMLHTRFDFERVVRAGRAAGQESNLIDRFENKYVNILKFEDYQFQRAR